MTNGSFNGAPNHPPALDIRPSATTSAGEAEQDIARYGIAGRTWEAARLIEGYLSSGSDAAFEPANPLTLPEVRAILELGSGTGFLAARLAPNLRLHQRLIVTDLPDVCPLLERNVAASPSRDRLLVRPLPWGDRAALDAIVDECGPIDLVICADLVYFPELFAPLLRSLLDLSAPSPSPPVVFAYQSRTMAKEQPFCQAFGAWFDLEAVSADQSRLGSDRHAFVWLARRKAATRQADVPAADADLLAARIDDAFELALLGDLSV